MGTLTFDEPTHTYSVDGRILPGITTILRSVGIIRDNPAMPSGGDYLARGSVVHSYIERAFRGYSDVVDARTAGMVAAALRAVAELGLTDVEPEALVAGPLEYATRIDLVATRGARRVVVNWKTPTVLPWYPIQSAGEALCLAGHGVLRYSVHLSPAGTYRVIQHSDPCDCDVFRAACAVYHWTSRSGQ